MRQSVTSPTAANTSRKRASVACFGKFLTIIRETMAHGHAERKATLAMIASHVVAPNGRYGYTVACLMSAFHLADSFAE